MKIIVVGHTGVIGEELLLQLGLKADGDGVLCLSRSPRSSKGVANDGVQYLKVDLSKANCPISNTIAWSEWQGSAMVLLAWNGNMRTDTDFTYENRNIVANCCRLARKVSAKRIVFISSGGAIYTDRDGIEEDSTLDRNKLSRYGEEKIWAEGYLAAFCKKESIEISVLRVATAYGKTASASQGVVAKWIRANFEGNRLYQYNTLDSSINFIHVRDVAKAIIKVIDKSISGLYNIGSERSQSLKEVLDIVERVSGKTSHLELSKSLTKRVFNISTAKWKSRTGREYAGVTEEAVREIFEALKRENI